MGALNWSRQTDATVGYSVSRVAWSMLNPQKQDWLALDRIERYKATNPEMGPVWRRAEPPETLKYGTNLDCLVFFADADLAGCRETSKSYDGFCAFLGNSGYRMFDWSSKRQTCVAQSSCESETNTAKSATNAYVWLRNGLSYMEFTFTKPTGICQDNQITIALCKSDKHHSRTRHFRVHVAVLRDAYTRRIAWYPWVPTRYMRGDLFNKLHQPIDHERLTAACGMSNMPISHLPDKGEPFELESWLEKVREEASQSALRKGKKDAAKKNGSK